MPAERIESCPGSSFKALLRSSSPDDEWAADLAEMRRLLTDGSPDRSIENVLYSRPERADD